MAGSHLPLGLASLIFVAGSLVLLFFVILSGVTGTSPLNDTYFLRADTGGITGARPVSQWTYFYVCGLNNQDCGGASPAMPFGHAWADDPSGVPDQLVGGYAGGTTSFYYFYMWRFGWVFYLIALFFEICAFFAGFLACCGRLGSVISGLIALIALFFLTIAVSLMTATFVKARDAFNSAGRDASIGKYAFGFSWAAWAALLIACTLFFVGFCVGRGNDGVSTRRRWRRGGSRHSYDGRRVKEEY